MGEKEIGSSRVDRRSRREAAASGDRKNMKKLLPSAGLDRILNRKLDVVGRTKGAVDALIGSPGFPPDNKPVFDQENLGSFSFRKEDAGGWYGQDEAWCRCRIRGVQYSYAEIAAKAAYWLWLVGWSRGRVVGLALVRCRGGGAVESV